MNDYIPSNIHLKNKDGVISVVRSKQPTATTVKSKLASRKVVFENPICLNDNCSDVNQPSIFNNNTEDQKNILHDEEPFDLKEQVKDLSMQLEEICKYARSSVNENVNCFCHELVGGKCLLPLNDAYNTITPRLITPPEVWVSKPDCCQSCTVPCRANVCVPEPESPIHSPNKKQLIVDEKSLQDNLNDIKHRLSMLQNDCTNKTLPSTSSKAERDVDEHLEKLNRQNLSQRKFLVPTSTETSKYRNIPIRAQMKQKALPNQQSGKLNTKSKLPDRRLESSQRNTNFSRQKPVVSPYNISKITRNTSRQQSQIESSNVKVTSPININDNNNDDPEITLNKLESYLGNSEIVLDSKTQEVERKSLDEEIKLGETKEMLSELRTIYQEVKELLLNVRNQVNENTDVKTGQTDVDANIDQHVVLSNSQPVLTPGSLLPSIRLAMEYSGKTMATPDEISQVISNLSDDPIVKATTALIDVNRRRNNLENNLATLESSHTDQSIFGLLDLMSKDKSSAEKARIQAMINDAIDKVTQEKKLEHPTSFTRISRPSTKTTTQPKSRSITQSKAATKESSKPYTSPSKSRNIVELFHHSKLSFTDRSPSPVTLTYPWRLNRRRAKRPLYPRSINDPVRPRTAVLRLSDENLAGISSPRERMSRTNTKVVRFIDDDQYGQSESGESQQMYIPSSEKLARMQTNASTKSKFGIIPLGMYQYSVSIPSKQTSEQLNREITTNSPDLLYEKGIGFNFRSNQTSGQHEDDANRLTRTDMEDRILSRLMLQVSEQLTRISPKVKMFLQRRIYNNWLKPLYWNALDQYFLPRQLVLTHLLNMNVSIHHFPRLNVLLV
uniref:Uncharacterized protein n=1 Tax=Trichobilharzia regenti TaxID=157069 RepID=A0AA85JDB9_TRIRE|nr:unnamed protein product [Trichobilharzia regenti]